MAKIIIKRKSSMAGCAIKFDVYLTNQHIGVLKNGDTMEIPVETGYQSISFKSKSKAGRSNDTTFNAVVNEGDEIVELDAYFEASSFVVEYADGAPHIPTFSASAPIPQPVIKRSKNKSSGLVGCAIVFAILFVVILCVVLISSGGDGGSSSSSPSSTQAINYIEISAEELFDAFHTNEVAAEQQYQGKYVKVTGVISNINSASTLTKANVLLTVDQGVFGCVQCNFNQSDVQALANLKVGQSVTITGVCNDLATFNLIINNCKIAE